MDIALLFGDSTGALLLIVVVGFALATGLLLFALFGTSKEARMVATRTQRLTERLKPAAAADAIVLRRSNSDSSIAAVDYMVKRWVPQRDVLRGRLERTGLPISLAHYVLATLITMMIAYQFASSILGLSMPLAIAKGLGMGIGIPHFVVSYLGARRRNKFIALFPEAIDLIVRGLKSGMPITDSISTVAREIGAPISTEFKRIEQSMQMGQSLDEALWEANKRLDTPEFKFFVISLSLQRETGGNLAETLENLSDILRRRRQMRLKIKAMSSEARASALIIGSLPFIMVIILYVIAPGYITGLFVDERGHAMIGVGLVSLMIGYGIMMKLVRFEI
jgi:tight adherence protein B